MTRMRVTITRVELRRQFRGTITNSMLSTIFGGHGTNTVEKFVIVPGSVSRCMGVELPMVAC